MISRLLFSDLGFVTLPASMKDELKLTCRVSADTSSVGCVKMLCVGFSSWVPEHLWLEPGRWMSFRWMSYQCKDLLIICQFSFRMVILDFSLFDLFPFFMLEAFLKYLVASGCLYVIVKHFSRSWQKSEDVDGACTFFSLGTSRFSFHRWEMPCICQGWEIF